MGCTSAKNCKPERNDCLHLYGSERRKSSPRKFRKRSLSSTSTGSLKMFQVYRQDFSGSSIPGHIQITKGFLILFEGHSDEFSWALETLSEFGSTHDVFQFKSGCKSATGRQVFRFQSRDAEVILHELQKAVQQKHEESKMRRLHSVPRSIPSITQLSSTSIDSLGNKQCRYYTDRQCYTASELLPSHTQPAIRPTASPTSTPRRAAQMYPRNRSSSMHNIGINYYVNVNDLDSDRSVCSEALNYAQIDVGSFSVDDLLCPTISSHRRARHRGGCGHGSTSSIPTGTTISGPSTPDLSDTDSKSTTHTYGRKTLIGYNYSKIDIQKTQALARFRENSMDSTDDGWRITRHSSGNLF